MQDQIAATEDMTLKFLRQLYHSCLEQLGEEHQQTRLLWEYISRLEYQLTFTRSELPAARLPHQPPRSVLPEPIAHI